jgi:hypothetical protein
VGDVNVAVKFMEGSCEHGGEPSDSTNNGGFLDY